MWHPRRAATFPRAHIETCRLVAGTHRRILLHLLPYNKFLLFSGNLHKTQPLKERMLGGCTRVHTGYMPLFIRQICEMFPTCQG